MNIQQSKHGGKLKKQFGNSKTHWKLCTYHRIFGFKKGPQYLYQLFHVLPKQTTCEIKALQLQVYIQQ